MKSLLAVCLMGLALALCNMIGRRDNGNANTNSSPETESSPIMKAAPPPPPAASPIPTIDVHVPKRPATPPPKLGAPPPDQSAPPSSRPGVPESSAASVPRRPATISGGVLNGKAISLPKPAYPPIARAAHVSGAVTVQVTVDENGNVTSASAVSGHPLLQASAVAAARQAKFRPTMLSGQPVKVTGVIVYNFVAQ